MDFGPGCCRGLFIWCDMRERCWIAIVYDWGEDGLTLAKTTNNRVLQLAKEIVIQEAQETWCISREVDDIKSLLDEAELRRLESVLGKLVPKWAAQ